MEDRRWLRGAAKLLEAGAEGEDWRALASYLGYNRHSLDQFDLSLQPGLALLTDWFTASNNTNLALEMIIAGLQQLQRSDVISVIREEEQEVEEPQVFISYQWESQEEVLRVRQYLEESQVTCWMDLGQMGGGDRLYQRIYQGLAHCRLVLCCLTPKFLVSDCCVKEILLADLLKKPIVPLMIQPTPWPPPGPLSLSLAPLVYVDLAGAGGHGGEGRQADWSQKMAGLRYRIQPVVSPPHTHNLAVIAGHTSAGREEQTSHAPTLTSHTPTLASLASTPPPSLSQVASTPLTPSNTQSDMTPRRGLLRYCRPRILQYRIGHVQHIYQAQHLYKEIVVIPI